MVARELFFGAVLLLGGLTLAGFSIVRILQSPSVYVTGSIHILIGAGIGMILIGLALVRSVVRDIGSESTDEFDENNQPPPDFTDCPDCGNSSIQLVSAFEDSTALVVCDECHRLSIMNQAIMVDR